MKPNKIRLAVPLSIGILMAAGCSRQTPQQSTEQQEVQRIGAGMQQSGTMSQQDYVRVREISHQTVGSHTISDGDLDWTLALLAKSNNSIARAKAMGVLSEIKPMSVAQKAKIAPAIAPYLHSQDELDRASAARVQKALQSQ
ncbi:MAG: hypothetical protein JO250_09850 [Armatimonadetes bacterium]|nr:hypothetical protein [Armatimonadota bacterium]